MTEPQVPRVSVVVLNYNGQAVLAGCLDSLAAQRGVAHEVIVVDNASTDGSLAAAARYPQFRLLRLNHNEGFCAGNHAGVKAAQGAYVALVNNDTVLPPDFLAALAAALDQQPNAWVAAPRIHNHNLDMAQFPRNGTLNFSGQIIQNVFRTRQEIFGAPGAALMFRREAVGLPFDEDYVFFHEDVYLSWRTWLAGHAVVAVPDVTVEHVGSAAFSALPDRYGWLWERNRWLNVLTFWSWGTLLKLSPLLGISCLAEWLSDCLAGRSVKPRWQAYAWLIRHPASVWGKRRRLQAQRRVADRDILRRMSCRLTNKTGRLGAGLNALSRAWCVLLGVKTYDSRVDR